LISAKDSEQVEKRKLLFFTLNYYWMDTEAYLTSKNAISLLRSHDELPEKEYFLKIGYKTFLIDLSRTKEELYAAFDATGARYKIKKAIKSGVIVSRAETAAEKQKFFDFYQAFVEDPKRKNKILALQKDELDKLEIFNALSAEDEYLGGIGLLPSPDKRYLLYKYSATLHRFCENELMLWHAIQYAKDDHYSFFDMSWMLPSEDKNSDMYRLYQFKKKFGGTLVDFYSYVKLRGPFKVPGTLFKLILKYFFKDDINNFTLCLKKLKIFK
jgi:lipid II:glycine glycyltransferase (peptidoglycan interpeptide bridge formation enzyme)